MYMKVTLFIQPYLVQENRNVHTHMLWQTETQACTHTYTCTPTRTQPTTHSSSSFSPTLVCSGQERGVGVLSESCRPALNLTNHTAREKDSEGVLELEINREGGKKKSKNLGGGGRWTEWVWQQSKGYETVAKKNEGVKGKVRKNCPLFLYCHIINCSYWSLCGKFKTGAILSQRLVTRESSVSAGGRDMRNVIRLAGAVHVIGFH